MRTPSGRLGDRRHVVVVNQHGDNRGDEAAMTAMVRGLAERLPDARFTIVHQFADRDSEVPLDQPVRYVPMRLPVWQFGLLLVRTLLRLAGIPGGWLLGKGTRAIVEAIRDADLVVSAPGGPYFGDLYADHEAGHWLLVWIAHLEHKPLALYAPSCGPFRNRLLNPIRRRGFRWFDTIALREQRSADMLRDLTGIEAVVTIDSALQDEVLVGDRSRWSGDGETLVVVAVRRPDEHLAEQHDRAVVAAIERIAAAAPTSVVFLPQLHGSTHRDAPYLESLASRTRGAARVQVAPEKTDSRAQRAIVASADLVIAGRYHLAVFAVASRVPVLVIPYEHKAMGLAEAAGIEDWAIWVDALDDGVLADRAAALLGAADDVRAHLAGRAPALRALAARTSDLVAGLAPT